MFSQDTIQKVSEALRKDYGLTVSEGEALELTRNLVEFFDTLMELDYQDKLD